MPFANCPHCGTQVSTAAPSCHHCGYSPYGYQTYGYPPSVGQNYAQPPAKKPSSALHMVVVIAGVLVLCGLLSALGSLGKSSSSTPASKSAPVATKTETKPKKYEPQDHMAWAMAQHFVKQRLKSPSTADFGGILSNVQDYTKGVKYVGDKTYEVRGWVDAKNSFNATIRSHFYVKMKHDDKEDSWTCLEGPVLN